MNPNTIMFRNKRDLIEWMERELPDDLQFMAPGVIDYTAKAASQKRPAPHLDVTLVFPTDALTEQTPADNVAWIVGPGGVRQVVALIPIIAAKPGAFQEAEECATPRLCDDCHKREADMGFVEDPFADEVYNKHKKQWYCSVCYKEAGDDV